MNTIFDDLHILWEYDPQRGTIRAPEADEHVDGDVNGYFCDSFADGVALLVEYEYLSQFYADAQLIATKEQGNG